MRAVMLERTGPPESLCDREIADPAPAAAEILIDVRASGVNFADLLQRLGLYGSSPKPPYVPGFEVAGEVVAVGEGAGRFAVGDRVVALTRFGGYAERVCAAQDAAIPLPDSIDDVAAAALPVNYLTAWICMFTMGGLGPGHRVLVHAAAGGVGTAAVQLARSARAECFASAGSDEKVEFLRRLGADHAINYQRQDFVEEVRAVVGHRGLDLILDGIGGETTRRGYELLAPLGRLVSYGLSDAVSGPRRNPLRALRAWWRTPRFNPIDLIGRNTGVFGFHLAHLRGKEHVVMEAFAEVLRRVEAAEISPVIAETFPLEAAGAAAAHHLLHSRRNIGKAVLVSG